VRHITLMEMWRNSLSGIFTRLGLEDHHHRLMVDVGLWHMSKTTRGFMNSQPRGCVENVGFNVMKKKKTKQKKQKPNSGAFTLATWAAHVAWNEFLAIPLDCVSPRTRGLNFVIKILCETCSYIWFNVPFSLKALVFSSTHMW